MGDRLLFLLGFERIRGFGQLVYYGYIIVCYCRHRM